eukprot:jgi/Mesvir1/28454/Mv15877-RA.1
MERYRRVDKSADDDGPISENEIRITTLGAVRNYLTYATTVLQEKSDEVVLKAMGRAINKTVVVAEILKRWVPGLHQNTVISSMDITDTWEPLEEGLVPLETTRHVSMISITLSKKPLDPNSTGYQPPLTEEELKMSENLDTDVFRGPGQGRGGRGRGWERGRWRGRGRRPGGAAADPPAGADEPLSETAPGGLSGQGGTFSKGQTLETQLGGLSVQ